MHKNNNNYNNNNTRNGNYNGSNCKGNVFNNEHSNTSNNSTSSRSKNNGNSSNSSSNNNVDKVNASDDYMGRKSFAGIVANSTDYFPKQQECTPDAGGKTGEGKRKLQPQLRFWQQLPGKQYSALSL
ncbi:ABC transporter H family member 2-like [Octopus bimaculoides]|uniref:ABC transporter H family member 2-like n=1 Tax=Octopus bimaculoides TaxID=37653 RepID=UPI00071CCD4A|nr:ABC transporter H family member 2-like [Octopus bimaculoides]|eukprot:XP_014780762.1 PREDICTED: ABC transporter H family member 2-like [Octopus bimaculoides]